jgi:3-oxoacyl-[acyl-carrier protein] reductase
MIIVSGASSGLGLDICQRLLGMGQNVIGLARDVSNLDFEAYSCNVASYDEIKEVSKKIKKKYGSVTTLINAAGVASMNLALMTPPKKTQELIQTNLIGTIYSCQVFGPLLIKNKGGSIFLLLQFKLACLVSLFM